MFNLRSLARMLLASIFIVGGWESLQRPRAKTGAAEEAEPIAEKVGISAEPEELVKLNGAIQLGGGIMLACGWMPRLAALVLAADLVPTTVGAHRFWEIGDPEQRRAQTMHALKNASIFGGLIITALDHGGRPSVFWMTRKAAERTGEAVTDTVEKLTG